MKLNWRYRGLYKIELTALRFLRNWIDGIVSYMKFVAYIKLNWRYCDSFEIELTVIMWWNRATFKYCVQMFDFGWANFYFEFWKHIVVWKSWSNEFHYFASILIFILNLKYSLMITWMQKFNGAFDIQENDIDDKNGNWLSCFPESFWK